MAPVCQAVMVLVEVVMPTPIIARMERNGSDRRDAHRSWTLECTVHPIGFLYMELGVLAS